MSDLTDKQQRFIEEYMVDLNATQAAIRAGYSKDSAAAIGYENLRKPEIVDAVSKAKAELREKTGVTAEWVIEKLTENVERSMKAIPCEGRNGFTGEWKYDGAVANKALELLGKHLALFTDRVEHGGSIPGIKVSLDLGNE